MLLYLKKKKKAPFQATLVALVVTVEGNSGAHSAGDHLCLLCSYFIHGPEAHLQKFVSG